MTEGKECGLWNDQILSSKKVKVFCDKENGDKENGSK